MTPDELFNMWIKDSEIDSIELGKESLKTSKLHSKYLKLYTEYSLRARKLGSDYGALRNKKDRYYRGVMSEEELKENGWSPFLLNIKRDAAIDKYLEEDTDLITQVDKKVLYETMADFCKEVIKSLHGRVWTIKTAVDHLRFVQGG